MRVLVTGGRGFIGDATVRRCFELGLDPMPFDRTDGCDVLDGQNVLDATKGCDAVIHLAGVLGTAELFDDPHRAVDANIHGALNVLQACETVGAAFVGITMPVSGWANVYTATKHCAQDLASAWHRHRGVPVSHVRAYNAYGPGQKHGPGHPRKIVPTFATEAYAGRPIPIWGDGNQTVDLVHVADLAKLLVFAATQHGQDEIYEGGSGVPLTVNQVADLVLYVTGSNAGTERSPMRPGEDPGTKIVAPREGGRFDANRFAEAVQSYRP